MAKPFFITTSIAYINAEPHIGFLYELVAADIIARHHRLLGDSVFFLTGTDEHGNKVAGAARESGQLPQAYADTLSAKFLQLKDQFKLSFDYFIRTTDPRHQTFVAEQWQKLAQAGVLEKRTYRGHYCTGCEAFKTVGEIEDGQCAIHELPLEKVEEENWFLIVSDEAKGKIKTWIESAVFPATRRQEVLNVVDSGAYDAVSVSRPKAKNPWGVAVPNDPDQVMYVWVDALFNYISALVINDQENVWPADIQLIGKDILKFHAVIWPALLLATGYELPKKLLVHGFINVEGKKMSKSLGNIIKPAELRDRYGVDGTRYLLLRQLNFFEDSNFSWDEFDAIYNGELANGLGNLLARTIGLANIAKLTVPAKLEKFDRVAIPDFQADLAAANEQVKAADKLITEQKLWVNPAAKTTELTKVVALLWETAERLEPYLPETALTIKNQLTTLQSEPLFPRLS